MTVSLKILPSERAAGIGDINLFCTSSKNSGGVDRGIFHRGGLGQELLVLYDGGFGHEKKVRRYCNECQLKLARSRSSVETRRWNRKLNVFFKPIL